MNKYLILGSVLVLLAVFVFAGILISPNITTRLTPLEKAKLDDYGITSFNFTPTICNQEFCTFRGLTQVDSCASGVCITYSPYDEVLLFPRADCVSWSNNLCMQWQSYSDQRIAELRDIEANNFIQRVKENIVSYEGTTLKGFSIKTRDLVE